MQLKQHPLSTAFPAMCEADFQSLRDSIEAIGVQNPITVYEGMVIDGWHRYRAANEMGMDCPTVDLGDVDPRDFVMAQNKARRHITQAQLAMATTAVYAWHPAHRPKKELHTECAVKTTGEMAGIAGVHRNTIVQAQAVQSKAAPEVVEAVKRGEIGLPKAAAIAKLPQSEQAAAIHKPTPKPTPTPEPQEPQEPEYTELDAARDQISDLQHEVERLSDRLAVEAIDASEEEKTAASETIETLRAEVKTLTAHLEAVTIARDTLQEENAQLKRQCQMYRNKLDKLEKATT